MLWSMMGTTILAAKPTLKSTASVFWDGIYIIDCVIFDILDSSMA